MDDRYARTNRPYTPYASSPPIYSRRKGATRPPEDAVYVGRGTPWGNPFVIGKDGTRDDVCEKFADYAYERYAEDPEWLSPLCGKSLVCWCAPKRCHAETLLHLANMTMDQAAREGFIDATP